MKTKVTTTLALFASLVAAQPAAASFYQIDCGSADGTVKMNNGHVDNKLVVTQYAWESGTGPKYTPVELSRQTTKVDVLDSKDLFLEQETRCSPTSRLGVWQKTEVNYKRIRITNTDGSTFNRDIVGVTPDQTAVEAFLICQEEWNSQSPCPEQK